MACCHESGVHWPLTLHRIFQPAIAVHQLAHGRALGAVRAAVDRESQPGSCPIHTPLATSATTVQPTEQCADVLADGHLRTGRRRGPLPLAHAGERERAERGKAAGDQAGAAQEGAAIEIATGWLCSAPASVPRRA